MAFYFIVICLIIAIPVVLIENWKAVLAIGVLIVLAFVGLSVLFTPSDVPENVRGEYRMVFALLSVPLSYLLIVVVGRLFALLVFSRGSKMRSIATYTAMLLPPAALLLMVMGRESACCFR